MLAETDRIVHGTTVATNALLERKGARVGLLTTEGHRDVLEMREGLKPERYNLRLPRQAALIPRHLRLGVRERLRHTGEAEVALDTASLDAAIDALKDANVEAVAVCLLWSIVNADHEIRVGDLLDQHLPGVPYTLSHALNPSLREYRRASSAAIDASLKPLMGKYMGSLDSRLREAGFDGRVLVVTTQGGAIDAADRIHWNCVDGFPGHCVRIIIVGTHL